MIPVKVKRMIKEGYYDLKYFNFKVMLGRMYCTFSDESINGIKLKNKYIVEFLETKYSKLISKYKNECNKDTCIKDNNIWVLWWSGYETMPNIIKRCYQNILENSNGHQVILLTKDNIKDFVDFPDFVWEKFNSNNLRIQHLADMIRVHLISNYGGLWLDASIYCNSSIPDLCFDIPLFSLKGKFDERFISNNQWTTFLIGGHKNNILCRFLDEFFIEYCKSDAPFIDYFMFDCAIHIAYNNIPVVKNMIDDIPQYDGDVYWLNSHLENVISRNLLDEFNTHCPIFSKIAWSRFSDFSNLNTLYEYLLKGDNL